MTKTNPRQIEGKKAINNLLALTKEVKKFNKKVNPIIKELEEMGVFRE